MTHRYVTQRDLNGTWSVQEVATNVRAIYRGKVLAGLDEKTAALHARRLNDRSIFADALSSPDDSGSLVSRIQQAIEDPLPGSSSTS